MLTVRAKGATVLVIGFETCVAQVVVCSPGLEEVADVLGRV